ncbi:hypothetical protein MY4824_007991 [Beauveria thailandica]
MKRVLKLDDYDRQIFAFTAIGKRHKTEKAWPWRSAYFVCLANMKRGLRAAVFTFW